MQSLHAKSCAPYHRTMFSVWASSERFPTEPPLFIEDVASYISRSYGTWEMLWAVRRVIILLFDVASTKNSQRKDKSSLIVVVERLDLNLAFHVISNSILELWWIESDGRGKITMASTFSLDAIFLVRKLDNTMNFRRSSFFNARRAYSENPTRKKRKRGCWWEKLVKLWSERT